MAAIAGCKATPQDTLVPALLTSTQSNTDVLEVLQTTMKEGLDISAKVLSADVFTTSSWLTLERAHNAELGLVTEMPLKVRLMTDSKNNCYLLKPSEDKTVSLPGIKCQPET